MTRTPASVRNMLACACLLELLGGCTTVVIHTAGKVSTENHFGILKLSLDEAHSSAIAVSGLGVASVPGTFAVGRLEWKGVFIAERDEESCLFVNFASDHSNKE
jgi:uncharacterized protein YceK